MNARFNHSTLTAHHLLIAVFACAVAGCWEEISYTPPAPGTSTANAPAEAKGEADDFAEDVAASLADDAEPEPPGETVSAVESESSGPVETTSTPEEPIATPPAADPARSSRRMAWLLGSNLSLAALANDRGAAEEKVADWFDKSQRLAKLLGTTAAELPPRPATADAAPSADRAIDYLFAQGQVIGRDLAAQHGDDHAALFELAVKSNILLVLYRPGAPVVESLSAAIEQSGQRAELPAEHCQPLLTLLNDGAPQATVRDAVLQLHADVDGYLSTVQP